MVEAKTKKAIAVMVVSAVILVISEMIFLGHVIKETIKLVGGAN